MRWDKLAFFASGMLFGTAGIRLLTSRGAKKAYTHTTAAALRCKECVMSAITLVKENADDILADAKQINEDRAAAEAENEIIPDSNTDQE